MTLILRKTGKLGDRTRWNLSFSGVSFSHKRGWLTLNSRGRSVIDLPGPHFTFRVGPTGTVVWFLIFLLFDLIVFLLKLLALPAVLVIDGTHEAVTNEEDASDTLAAGFVLAGLALGGFYAWLYFTYIADFLQRLI